MSTLVGSLGITAKGEQIDNSSGDENSDAEYELQEIRPHISGSRSSLSRRQRKKCCTLACLADWSKLVGAYTTFYVINGLFTIALAIAISTALELYFEVQLPLIPSWL